MKFLVDECTGPAVADQSPGLPDDGILEKAFHENWILITNDKDFGEMIYRQQRPHKGVIFLRLGDERNTNKIHILITCCRTT